tara:strand:+ start:553 stop:753 length:201 start_codon:yes stop_codon:yes gene_type:complete
MSEFQTAAESFPIWKAIVWIFYPMTVLVLIEVFLRLFNNDDDDDEGGKGIRITQPQMRYATAPAGA